MRLSHEEFVPPRGGRRERGGPGRSRQQSEVGELGGHAEEAADLRDRHPRDVAGPLPTVAHHTPRHERQKVRAPVPP